MGKLLEESDCKRTITWRIAAVENGMGGQLRGLNSIREPLKSKVIALALTSALALTAAGCQDDTGGLGSARAYQPIPDETLSLMDQMGTTKYSPVLVRTFKKEAELEVWKMKADGTYGLLKTYPMCRWSGQLGPKRREGDRQVPEGFYYVTPKRMNPNSSYYLSFNVGYPNAYDRAHGRTGSHIMVHGACSSRGCFSMSDNQMAEIYAVVREAFSGGQKKIQLQSLPFRMTPKNIAKHRLDRNFKFWKKLKEGSDTFEVAKREPQVLVCNRQYVFNSSPVDPATRVNPRGICPPLNQDQTLLAAIQRKDADDSQKVTALVSKGAKPVKLVYADGGQHRAFAHVLKVSRPGALARGPIEITLDNRGRPIKTKPKKAAKTQLAKSKPKSSKNQVAKNKTEKPNGELKNVTAFAAAPSQPAKPAKAPLLKRWFGGLIGGDTAQPKPAEQTLQSAVDQAEKARTPLPPQRNKASNPPSKGAKDKRASALPALIRGSYRPLPPSLNAYAPVR